MILTRLYSDKKKEKPAYINDDSDLSKYRSPWHGLVSSTVPTIPALMGAEGLRDKTRIAGIPLFLSGLVGRYAGNRRAEALDRQGKSDKEIKTRSDIHGALVGAAAGAGGGALLGQYRRSSKGHSRTGEMAALGALLAGIGGGLGTHASVSDRLEDRKKYADRS